MRGKVIVLLYNEAKLVEGETVRESRIMYLPVSTLMRQKVPFTVDRTDLYE